MEERFKRLVGELLENEVGGDPEKYDGYVPPGTDDPGGETKYGISKRTYPHLNIAALTLQEAKDIYYNDWWKRWRWDEIQDDQIAQELLDIGPNLGPSKAHKLLQQAINSTTTPCLKEDGILGALSIKTINNHPCPGWLLDRFKLLCIRYHLSLKNLRKFLPGWIERDLD